VNYASFADAAAYLGVSVRTIRRHIESIPHHRTPFGVRFSKDDLDSIIGPRKKGTAR
jgi:excisionase family DNA binding protein